MRGLGFAAGFALSEAHPLIDSMQSLTRNVDNARSIILNCYTSTSQEPTTMSDAPRHRSSDTSRYPDSPKELRDSHRNAFSESLINCRGLKPLSNHC